MLTAILDIAHLVGVATAQHLFQKSVIVAGVIGRMSLFEDIPMISKDLLEDVRVPPGFDNHEVAPSQGSRLFWLLRVKRFYHVSPVPSTPSIGVPSVTSLAKKIWGIQEV
jgi:hypothetical protein